MLESDVELPNSDNALEISRKNYVKLTRILQILEGDGQDNPGLVHRTVTLERIVYGDKGQQGLVGKIDLIWKLYVWLLCTMSAVIGFILREAIRLLWHV